MCFFEGHSEQVCAVDFRPMYIHSALFFLKYWQISKHFCMRVSLEEDYGLQCSLGIIWWMTFFEAILEAWE